MINFLTNFLTIIVLGIVQISFLVTWPRPINSINIILILIIFLTIAGYYKRGLWSAVGGGLFLELFSYKVFGLTTVSLLATVLIINFLFINFFTNYSFYSLTTLGVIGTVNFYLFILLGNFILSFLGYSNWIVFWDGNFFYYLAWQVVLNLIILYAIFFTLYFLKGRLKFSFPFDNLK